MGGVNVIERIAFPESVSVRLNPGLPRSGKNIWRMIFFQVREKSGNFVDGQRNLVRTWAVREKSGNLKINGYGRQSLDYLFILFKRGKDVHSHEIVKGHLPPHWGLLLKERICSLGSKFFPLRVAPKFEVMQLTPLK